MPCTDEIGIGNIFADYFKPIARLDANRNIWFVYDGSIWQPDEGGLAVAELAKLLADRLYTFALQIKDEDTRNRYIKRVQKLQLRKNRKTMIEDAKSVHPVLHSAFDRDNYLFNCRNGTLDLRTMAFRPHDPKDFLTIPFERHFEEHEQDKGLKAFFSTEENLSGIFNWCVEGYRKFCKHGLEKPEAVKRAIEKYRADSDRIGQFIEAWLEVGERFEVRTSAAYRLYNQWCEKYGYHTENVKNFNNAINTRFELKRKRPDDGSGSVTTMIIGCKFRESELGEEGSDEAAFS